MNRHNKYLKHMVKERYYIISFIIIMIILLGTVLPSKTIESSDYGLVTIEYKEVNLLEEPVIEVRLNGVSSSEPIKVKAYYPAVEGMGSLSLDKGRGAKFQADARSMGYDMSEVLRSAGGWSDNAGLGLLLFITRYSENETHIIAETMTVSVPLKPSYLERYKTIIEVDYKPNILDAIAKTRVSDDDAGVGQEQPPDNIDDTCYRFIMNYYCYEWELNNILYDTGDYGDPLPILVTMVNDVGSAEHVDMVNHDINVYLGRFSGSELMFSTSMNVLLRYRANVSEVHVPGPGFSIGLGSHESRKDLLDLNCVFDNVYGDNIDNSGCHVDGFTQPGLGGSFEWMGYVATGILGRIIVAEYTYSWKVCTLPDMLCTAIGAVGYSYAVWVVPATVGDDKLVPWVLVDDTVHQEDTVLDQVAGYINYSYTKSGMYTTMSSFIHVDTSQVFSNFRVSTRFGVAVPVGLVVAFLEPELTATPIGRVLYAVGVGIAYNTYDFTEYNIVADQTIYYDYSRMVTVNVYNATVDYYINELDDYYDAVVMAVDPD